MGKFDEQSYIKRVLSPAVEAFQKEGRLPDVFERYDLPLDIADVTVIEATIHTVVNCWNKTKNNPRYTSLLASLLNQEEQKRCRTILRDQIAREKHREIIAEERRLRAAERFAELDKSVELIAGKGFITPGEKTTLLNRFTRGGLTEKEVLDHIRVPVKEEVQPVRNDGLPKAVRDDIRSNLAVFGKHDLYDFLGISQLSSKEQINNAYRKLEADWRQKKVDHQKTAAQKLLGFIQTYLVNGDPAKYQTALTSDLLEALRPDVELAAADKHITTAKFQKLVEQAKTQGIGNADATNYIISLAKDFGAAVESVASEEMIRCANCQTAFARKNSPDNCTTCGQALWLKCPKCKKRVAAAERACAECGFKIADRPRVELLLREAQLALQEGELALAQRNTQEAQKLWPEHSELAALSAQIKSRQAESEKQHQQLGQALADQKLFEARRICLALISKAQDYKGYDGKDARQWRSEIDRRIAEVETWLAKAREHERNRRLDEAAAAYLEAQRLATDADEARQGLLRCPPQPPLNVRAQLQAGQVQIEWMASASTGEIEYLVVGKRDGAPSSCEDGQLIARTPDIFCQDKTAQPGSVVHYAVCSERHGARSRLVPAKGLLIAREVDQFSLEVRNGAVHGSWQFNAPNGRVRIFRQEGQAPAGREGDEIKPTGTHHFVDRAVQLGRVYYYRALVEYHTSGGEQVFTAGRLKSVRPEAPPQKLSSFNIAAEPDRLLFSWTPVTSGEVKIYRTNQEFPWPEGAQIQVGQLAEFGLPLDGVFDRNGNRQAQDLSLPRQTLVYYTAVTVSGDAAVVGARQSFIATEDVSELRADDRGHYLQLLWRWPDGCQSAVVAWRTDVHPQDANDELAVKRRIARGEYERQGGFRVEKPLSQPYYFAVFALVEINGATVHSSALRSDARAALRLTSQVGIHYSIESASWYQRSRKKLVLKTEQDVPNLPEIVLVARPQELQPRRIEDGQTLVTFSGLNLDAQTETALEFSLEGVARPVYLRLFFRDPAAYQRFQLLDPPPAQAKVR